MGGIKLIALFGALAVTGWGCSNSLTPASKRGTQSANPDTTGEQAAPTVIAKIKKETRRSTDDISWGGPLQNSKGWAGFVLSTKGLTGTIDIYGAGDYKILPIGDNLHAVVLPDNNVNLID